MLAPWYERLISLGVVAVMFFILVLVGGMGGGDLQLMLGASLLAAGFLTSVVSRLVLA